MPSRGNEHPPLARRWVDVTAMYEATWDSVRTHTVPDWYEDAKLGVFLHWGLYSVPGWAPQVPDIQQLLVHRGPRTLLRENPYAEWYRNSMLIRGSPTQGHHRKVYGDDYPYDNFVRVFNDASARANLDGIAELCQAAGARYAVLTTKHHEGFALWPTTVAHPVKGDYHSARDLVGDLTTAVRARGMRMGLYYSGGYDWPYNGAVLKRAGHVVLAVSDWGIGVPADDLGRIFEKFYRRHHVKGFARPADGTGLGLAIAKGIVEAHGGRIWAERRSEGGVTVRLRLPLEIK